MTAHSEETVEEFIKDLKRRGYSKMDTIKEVRARDDLTYGRAYYLTSKYWDVASTHDSKVGSC